MKGARPLNQTEVRALVRATQGTYAVRDRCLIQLGLNVGLRITNLVQLTVGQVVHAGQPRRYLSLPAHLMKSRRGHTIPLNTPARARIDEMQRWKKHVGEPTDPCAPLFRSREGGFMTTRRAAQIISAAADRAGLEPGVSTHSLRKTLATTLMERGVSLRVIQELLGHRELTTTAQYIGTGRKALEDGLRMLE
jgi:site-specific recombinase XerD